MDDAYTVKVWDLLVRVFHWTLVAGFFIAYISAEESEDIHELSGYAVLGLVLLRIVWGLVGSHYARFSQFIYGRQKVSEYIRGFMRARPKHYYGHNPAGGWAVVFMLVMLLAISYTGLELEALEGEGPLASVQVELVSAVHADGDEQEADEHSEYKHEESAAHEFWEESHEVLVNIMVLFILFHIAAVLISSGMHEENLVKAMFTGRKKRVENSED